MTDLSKNTAKMHNYDNARLYDNAPCTIMLKLSPVQYSKRITLYVNSINDHISLFTLV